jgi:hypothetical protein
MFRMEKEKMDSAHPQECRFKLPLRLVVHSGRVGWGRKWGTLVADCENVIKLSMECEDD